MDIKEKYLKEITPQLQRAGFVVGSEHGGQLPVEWNGELLCHVRDDGALLYQKEILSNSQLDEALDRVTDITQTTLSYMRQMAQAPPLRADGLSGDYRLLAEFDGVVLAGHEREGPYGVEFITWARDQDGTGLWQGHYMDNNFAAARQEFAIRSGLVDQDQIFSAEQLTEIYRSIHETLDLEYRYPITDSRRKILESACEQIEDAVADLSERVGQSNQAELELANSHPDQGMTFLN